MMCITPATVRTAVSALTILFLLALTSQEAQGQCEIQKFVSPDQFPEDFFGGAVGVDEDMAAIGNVLAYDGLGIVYIYRYDPQSMQWFQEAELHSPEPDPEAEFGSRLAVRDQCIVVAAGNATGAEPVSGAAYVYRLQDAEWTCEAKLMASDGEAGDFFGSCVALDSDLAIVGARDDVVEGVSQAGSAYVFRHVGSQWIEEAKLTHPGAQVMDLFGQSVAIQGDVALVGAHGVDHEENRPGSAFVFRRTDQGWALEQELRAFDGVGLLRFGYAVSLSGTGCVAAVGAPEDTSQNGAVYVYRYEDGQWLSEAKLTAADPVGPFPYLGARVVLSTDGGAILAGAPLDQELGFNSGAAHVFRHDGTQWHETAKLLASDGASYAHFGAPVSLSGDMALVGAASAAAAYMFAGFSAPDCNHNDQPDSCDIFEGTSDDLNVNGIPDECEAIGDLDGDGAVNVRDLLALLAAWGACDEPCPPACTGDTNGDCIVNWIDLITLLKNWSGISFVD
jgi:hypothetical protein